MNTVNYNHLYYFYITAKLEGITTASKYLNTSQSSISTQIKILEDLMERKLFKKNGRKIELTNEGRELFFYCKRGFEVFEQMQEQVFKKPNSSILKINIGVSTDIDRPFITGVISNSIKKSNPQSHPLVNLISVSSAQLFEQLKLGQLDLLITSSAFLDSGTKLLNEFLFPVNIYGSKPFIYKRKKATLEQFIRDENLKFVLPSKLTTLRNEIDLFFQKQKIAPKVTFESNIFASVIRASCDGLGVTILPHGYVNLEVQSGKLYLINEEPLWNHKLMAISNRTSIESEKKQFVDYILYEISNLI